MRSILQDVRYALRQFRKSPGFAVTVVAVLALGMGANIAVFTILNGVLLRPLPYAHPESVVAVRPDGPMKYYAMSYANLLRLRQLTGVNLQIGSVIDTGLASVEGPGGRVQIMNRSVSASLLPMLGVQPAYGRLFQDQENDPGTNHVVILSDDVWRKLYGGDARVVGKTLAIQSIPYTILGVMPKGFSFPNAGVMEVWTPGALDAASRSSMTGEQSVGGDVYARLPDGMSAAQLAAGLTRAQGVIAKELNDRRFPEQIKVIGYQQSLNDSVRRPLELLYLVVFGVWALACLNVASIMLTRAIARMRENAVRSALGASGGRLLQQSVVESVLLSASGALAGSLLSESAIRLLWHEIDYNLPLTSAIRMDWRVAVCMVVLTFLSALITGAIPALRAMRRDVRSSLRGVAVTASVGQNRLHETLVIAQLALTLAFLVGAGLFLRTIDALRHVPLGFSERNVLTGGVSMNQTRTQARNATETQPNIVQTAYLPLLDRLRAIPGVKVVALSSVLPLRHEFTVRVTGNLDHVTSSASWKSSAVGAQGRVASAGLVDALGIPVVRGRFFNESDTGSAPPVIVVNQAFVDRYLPGKDPIGHVFTLHDDMRIVGVIGDTKQSRVTDTIAPEVYFCLAQMQPKSSMYFVATAFMQVAIRAAVPADMLRAQFDKALHEVAPYATTTDVKTIQEAVEDSFGSQTLIAHLLEAFAALAMLIASVGLYGLLSFTVAQRTREIGVRIAVGALQSNILSLVLGRAMLLVAVGLVAGAAISWFAVKFAGGYLYGVQAHDGPTFAAVILVLAAASFLAAWLPARRAASVDPILALRSE